MSNISGLLGTAGGFKGTGVDAPNEWVDDGKLNTSNAQVQSGMGNQNSLLTALQAQNGLGAQAQNYQQLQGVINGTGPNPAQAQLAQATSANTANQAAMMAGQRGSSQNTGLIARQAAMQGGANQQNAAGQAATLQAQQSLNGINAAGQMANAMASNQIGQTNANEQAAQANLTGLMGGNAQQNANRTSLISGTAQQQAAVGGGAMSGAGSSMTAMAASGGPVEQLPTATTTPDQSAYAGASKFGKFLSEQGSQSSPTQDMNSGDKALYNGASDLGKGIGSMFTPSAASKNEQGMEPAEPMARGGKVPVLLSPGEKKLTPQAAKAVARGANPDEVGQDVAPGTKPKVGGAKNSYANDVVKDNLDPGTIILPRSVTQSKHPHWAAMRFVHAHMMANGGMVPMKPKGKK